YLYASDGRKLRVSTSGPGCSSSVTDYASNVVYRDGSLERILVPGGYMTDGGYRFFVTDHLGIIRAVTDASGNVLHTYDYYPYGVEFPDGAASGSCVIASGCGAGAAVSDVVAVQSGVSDGATGSGTVPDGLGVTIQPYRFNGKESQKFAGLPYLDYGARYYHPLSSRWTTMDPMAEKYYSVSPYAFCSGNPVNFVDWDGMDVWNVYEDGSISWVKQSKRDVVRTMDANGDIISRKSFKKNRSF
ncbi:RHS repeat-associated core domain-containing protein, partial [uncultured Bacteroides sp.]|uniref:RHS repeat-associated core domain-containing protein n=1 Tax=uncultured Bacteroides sp. TaxID=162156 RepID=UPI00259204B6